MLCSNGIKNYDKIIAITQPTEFFASEYKGACNLETIHTQLIIYMVSGHSRTYQQSLPAQRVQQRATLITDSVFDLVEHVKKNAKDVLLLSGNYGININCETKNKTEDSAFTPLGAHYLTQYALKENNKIIQKPWNLYGSYDSNILSRVHSIAKQYNIVTYYSSMIVLVNDQQRKELAAAEAQSKYGTPYMSAANSTYSISMIVIIAILFHSYSLLWT